MKKFGHIKPGDTVTRMLAGTIQVKMVVSKVTDDLITCGADGIDGWTFSTKNGAEIDEELGWNEQYTGSYLKL